MIWRWAHILLIILCLLLAGLAVGYSERTAAEARAHHDKPDADRIKPAWIRLICTFADRRVTVIYTQSQVRFEDGPAIPVISAKYEGDHFQFEARSSAYHVVGKAGPASSVTLAEIGSAPQVLPCHDATSGGKPVP